MRYSAGGLVSSQTFGIVLKGGYKAAQRKLLELSALPLKIESSAVVIAERIAYLVISDVTVSVRRSTAY